MPLEEIEIQISREQLRGLATPVVVWHRLVRVLTLLAYFLCCAALVTLLAWSSVADQWNLAIPSEWKVGLPEQWQSDLSDAEFVAGGCLLCAMIVVFGGMYPVAALRNRAWKNLPRRFFELVMNTAKEAVTRHRIEAATRRQVVHARDSLVRRGLSETKANREILAMMATEIDRRNPEMADVSHSMDLMVLLAPALFLIYMIYVMIKSCCALFDLIL